jgi:hypothetical protein
MTKVVTEDNDNKKINLKLKWTEEGERKTKPRGKASTVHEKETK